MTTRTEARDELRTLSDAATYPTLTDAQLDIILTQSRLKDNEDRPPSDPDFVEENWDLLYATALCYELKQASFSKTAWLKEFTSENATFKKDPPDFQALADWYRDQSTVGGDSGAPAFVAIDNRVPYRLRPRSEVDC